MQLLYKGRLDSQIHAVNSLLRIKCLVVLFCAVLAGVGDKLLIYSTTFPSLCDKNMIQGASLCGAP